eukprot:4950629-Amphidinium_carterae.1
MSVRICLVGVVSGGGKWATVALPERAFVNLRTRQNCARNAAFVGLASVVLVFGYSQLFRVKRLQQYF